MKDEQYEESDFVVVPIEDSIDLHTYSPKDIKELIPEYLEECSKRGFTFVRIIHGKGIGIQREIVRSILAKSPLVESYEDAPLYAGHWGATVVYLKTTDDKTS
ncbi:MAG: Smr/MutS family protein [Acidobacteriota bacterium]|nr:Smr/MutS family protein [Blastocatellia bacterium]MDW8412214.1 Smr/MutS family protein [Acidobacteriota bacterium]